MTLTATTLTIPQLVLEVCPFGCQDCKGDWVNPITAHQIICGCPCHSSKE